MKRRAPPKRGSPAHLRELSHFFFARILKAESFGDSDKIVQTAQLGLAATEDHRSATAAAIARKRHAQKIGPLILVFEILSPHGEPLTVDQVQAACAKYGLSFEDATIIRWLKKEHLFKRGKVGRKPKK